MRRRTRYPAQNMIIVILANSPGWKRKPPTLIQRWTSLTEPLHRAHTKSAQVKRTKGTPQRERMNSKLSQRLIAHMAPKPRMRNVAWRSKKKSELKLYSGETAPRPTEADKTAIIPKRERAKTTESIGPVSDSLKIFILAPPGRAAP